MVVIVTPPPAKQTCTALVLFGPAALGASALLPLDLFRGLTRAELTVVQHNLVVCLFYRLGNLALIAARASAEGDAAKHWGRKLLFRLFGLLRGQRVVNVTDLDLAMAVLRASDAKGDCLEK